MKTVTLTPRGRYIVVSFPGPDGDVERRLRDGARLKWKPGMGGWVTEVKDVGGLVTHLKSLGLGVRFGSIESPTRAARAAQPPEPTRPRALVDAKALKGFRFTPTEVRSPRFQDAFVARWREPGTGLPPLEPVDLARLDLDFEVPGFRGELYGFQREAVAFLRALRYRGIVADEMGLGKTIMAIVAALLARERTLVVAPAAVKYNWAAEIERFTDERVRIVNGSRWEGPADAFFTVMNYDVLPRQLARVNSEGFGLVVLDEAHYVKNPRARRTQAALAIEAKRRILLTGTPLLNRPEELFPLLDFVQPGKWGTERDFRYRFARRVTRLSPDGRAVSGAAGEHLRDLRDRLRAVMIRRRKADVLRELPSKTVEVQPIELSRDGAPAYRALESDLADHLAEHGVEGAFRGHGWMRTLAKMHALKQFLIAERLGAAEEWLRERAEEGDKVVVFSQYLLPLHTLHARLGAASVLIDGSVGSEERLARANRLQREDDVRFLVGQIQAAGTGLNLTAARRVLFLDLAWTPAAHAQATDRVHRIGQTRDVRVTFLVTPGTIDEHLQRVLLEKQAVINTVMGEEQEILTETRVMRKVAESLLAGRA